MKLIDWVKDNLGKVVAVPLAFNGLEFFALLFDALRDGVVSDAELHALMKAGDSVNMIFLAVVLAVLKYNNKK